MNERFCWSGLGSPVVCWVCSGVFISWCAGRGLAGLGWSYSHYWLLAGCWLEWGQLGHVSVVFQHGIVHLGVPGFPETAWKHVQFVGGGKLSVGQCHHMYCPTNLHFNTSILIEKLETKD